MANSLSLLKARIYVED
jgi:hypothetical protein